MFEFLFASSLDLCGWNKMVMALLVHQFRLRCFASIIVHLKGVYTHTHTHSPFLNIFCVFENHKGKARLAVTALFNTIKAVCKMLKCMAALCVFILNRGQMYIRNGNMVGKCLRGANEDFIFSPLLKEGWLRAILHRLTPIKFTGWLLLPTTLN